MKINRSQLKNIILQELETVDEGFIDSIMSKFRSEPEPEPEPEEEEEEEEPKRRPYDHNHPDHPDHPDNIRARRRRRQSAADSKAYHSRSATDIYGKRYKNPKGQFRQYTAGGYTENTTMKITKTQLKQIVLEELKNTMSEMAMDEMAFSMADVDAAAGDVDKYGGQRRAQDADEMYAKLISEFRHLINKMGGIFVIDPKQRIGRTELAMGFYDPYNRDLAVLYNVLSKEAEKLHSYRGHAKIENNSNNMVTTKDDGGLKKVQLQALQIIEKLEEIAEYAEAQNNAPGLGSDEPFLSVDNANYIGDMAQKLRRDWLTGRFGQ